jgi:hypothetical protein
VSSSPSPSKADMEQLCSMFGFEFSGDIGDWTCYRTYRGRPVFFLRAPPMEPPSPLQVIQRNRFITAQRNWKAASPAIKRNWESLTLKSSLCLTGQNLWISFSLVDRSEFLPGLMRKAGVTVTYPPFVP